MCGITGIFHAGRKPVESGELRAMTESLAHRGPDGHGYYTDANLGLGHRRLAVLDLTRAGAQPMTSHDGKWVISYNGEVYNLSELRADLLSRGVAFKSRSDTEVVLEGIGLDGTGFLNRINGMFALAAWHKPTRTLYLARDRYGIKPLYYFFKNGCLLFGSEIKAILSHPLASAELNYEALNEYFTFQNVFRHHTLFKGVRMLPPATTARICEGGEAFDLDTWWDFDFSHPDETLDYQQAREEVARLLRVAVERQLTADVPVGSYLSGGIDSGGIVAMASNSVPRITTFTAGFEMSRVQGVEATFDERINAEIMANVFKTEHYEQVINAGDIRWSLPRVVHHLEDLRLGMSYPNYYISRLASKFVKVCLTGTGGDELFGGYPWRYFHTLHALNRSEYLERYYNYWQRLVTEEDKGSLFTPSALRAMKGEDMREVFADVFRPGKALDLQTPEGHVQSSLYFESKTFLSGLFIVGDKLAMANGLEERFPFLDNDLVDFSQKIPANLKLGGIKKTKKIDENEFARNRKFFYANNQGKMILRQALAHLLPSEIVQGRKQGFSSPEESWYRGENASYIRETLLDPKAVYKEFINPTFVRARVEEHTAKKANHRLLIWSLLCFEWWCRVFLQGEAVE